MWLLNITGHSSIVYAWSVMLAYQEYANLMILRNKKRGLAGGSSVFYFVVDCEEGKLNMGFGLAGLTTA